MWLWDLLISVTSTREDNIMTEWKKYTGSDEQIEEIVNSRTDVLCRYQNGTERFKSEMFIGDWKHKFLTEYLICNHHPLEDMICQQARTGQYVWIKVFNATAAVDAYEFVSAYAGYSAYKTTKPNWNISGAEYSFTEFRD